MESILAGYPQKISAIQDLLQLGQFNDLSSSIHEDNYHSMKNNHINYYRIYIPVLPMIDISQYFYVEFGRFYISF